MKTTKSLTAVGSPPAPTVTEFKLDSGLGGLFVDMPHCQAFSFSIVFRAGDYLCPEDKPDLAHFLEHLVLMANEDYQSQEEFSLAFQANGGYNNAYTGSLNVGYQFDVPDSDWSRALDLALLAVSKPLFLPDEFASEKDVVRNEHRLCLDDPETKILRVVGKAMGFPSVHPDDRLACLDSIGVDDVKDYHRRTHTLGSARLVLAGHLPPSRQKLIKQKLASLDLPPGDLPPMPSKKLKGAGLVYDHKSGAETVTYDLSLAVPGSLSDPSDRVVKHMVNRLFFAGDHSWVFGRARKRGLVYSMYNYMDLFGESSRFTTIGQVKLENLEAVLDIVTDAIDRLLAGDLSDEDFDYQKNSLAGWGRMYYLAPRQLVSYFEDRYINNGFVDPVDYSSCIESVDKDLLISVANKLFEGFDWTLGLLGEVPPKTRKKIETKLNRHRTAN